MSHSTRTKKIISHAGVGPQALDTKVVVSSSSKLFETHKFLILFGQDIATIIPSNDTGIFPQRKRL